MGAVAIFRSTVLAAALLASPALAAPAGKAEPDRAAFARDFAAFADRMAASPHAPPGFVVVAVRGGGAVFEKAYGTRDLASGAPLTLDTPIYNASITKAYTGLLAARLDAEGVIPLDATLKDVWPRVTLASGQDPTTVTVARLLSHSSGLSDDGLVFRSVVTGEFDSAMVPGHLAAHAKAIAPSFLYDNLGPFIYSAMVEARTGEPWREAVTRRVFRPLGLTRTTARLEDFPAAEEDVAAMQSLADAEAGGITVEPWDYLYYAEKVRGAKHDVDPDEVKPYFELNRMIEAAFYAAERRYGTRFTEITGKVPVFHPDVRVWEVTDVKTGKHIGLFYGDYFARGAKRSGSWSYNYRDQSTYAGSVTPLVSVTDNFVRTSAGEPVLLSVDDARRLFHHVGHALSDLLQEVRYSGFAETPDFVSFPAQVNENWVLTRDVLERYARHYKTGEAIPQTLIDKLERMSTFNQAYATVEYLASSFLDLAVHSAPDGVVDPDKFEREELRRLGMPKEIAPRHRLPNFAHVFYGDHFANYYSYFWAGVLEADTWRAFQEAGSPWDRATADRFRRHVLSTGDSTDRTAAYRAFRGRDPDVKAFLQKRDFPTTDAPTN